MRPLNDAERVQYVWLIAELFFMFEGFFRQYRRGLISKATWEPMEMSLVAALETIQGRAWWESGVGPLSGEFRDHIDEARKRGTDFVFPDVGKRVKPDSVE